VRFYPSRTTLPLRAGDSDGDVGKSVDAWLFAPLHPVRPAAPAETRNAMLRPVLYPPSDAWRNSEVAIGCPTFGEDSVVGRPYVVTSPGVPRGYRARYKTWLPGNPVIATDCSSNFQRLRRSISL
jgi:hypothetical protein